MRGWILAILILSGTVKPKPQVVWVKINGVNYKVVKAL